MAKFYNSQDEQKRREKKDLRSERKAARKAKRAALRQRRLDRWLNSPEYQRYLNDRRHAQESLEAKQHWYADRRRRMTTTLLGSVASFMVAFPDYCYESRLKKARAYMLGEVDECPRLPWELEAAVQNHRQSVLRRELELEAREEELDASKQREIANLVVGEFADLIVNCPTLRAWEKYNPHLHQRVFYSKSNKPRLLERTRRWKMQVIVTYLQEAGVDGAVELLEIIGAEKPAWLLKILQARAINMRMIA